MLAAYSKELAETDGLGEKGLVQINWAKRLIQALHKPVVMQGLPTENEISAMAILTVNLEDSDTAKIIHRAAFESGARWAISELSGSPTVGNRAAGQSGSVDKCNCRYPKYNGYTCSNCDLPYY